MDTAAGKNIGKKLIVFSLAGLIFLFIGLSAVFAAAEDAGCWGVNGECDSGCQYTSAEAVEHYDSSYYGPQSCSGSGYCSYVPIVTSYIPKGGPCSIIGDDKCYIANAGGEYFLGCYNTGCIYGGGYSGSYRTFTNPATLYNVTECEFYHSNEAEPAIGETQICSKEGEKLFLLNNTVITLKIDESSASLDTGNNLVLDLSNALRDVCYSSIDNTLVGQNVLMNLELDDYVKNQLSAGQNLVLDVDFSKIPQECTHIGTNTILNIKVDEGGLVDYTVKDNELSGGSEANAIGSSCYEYEFSGAKLEMSLALRYNHPLCSQQIGNSLVLSICDIGNKCSTEKMLQVVPGNWGSGIGLYESDDKAVDNNKTTKSQLYIKKDGRFKAGFTITGDVDLRGVEIDSDLKRTVVVNLEDVSNKMPTHDLYVLKSSGDGVYVCPNARTLAEVEPSCSGVVNFSYSDCLGSADKILGVDLLSCDIIGDDFRISGLSSSGIGVLDGDCIPKTGNWIVLANCTMPPGTYISGGDILLQSNTLLTVPTGTVLDVDFAESKLFIENGSGVLVKDGAKIS